jgi:hypothetical protein
VVGSPGIGKSWSLIYGLQQALLYHEAFVVFTTQKNQHHFICICRQAKVFVGTSHGPHILQSEIFHSYERALVLFNPKDTEHGGAKFGQGSHQLIFAASHDKRHFASDIQKSDTLTYAIFESMHGPKRNSGCH